MEWIRGDPIGHGSFATVNLAIPTTHNSQLMALKSCSVSHSASLINEKSVLDQLKDCPYIINCLGDCFSYERGEKLYNLILEYANCGTVQDKLKKTEQKREYPGLPEFDVKRYTSSILRGVKYIHENGFVHCDIKLQNVLLFEIDGVDTAKIADFGLAKIAGEKLNKFELRGTPMYMSPEMVAGGDQEAPADIWAVGCVVAEMVTGAPAWGCGQENDLCGLLMKIGMGEEVPEIPGKLSDEGKDFLGKCFVKDPRERWTAEMLLNHPFLANLDDDYFTVTSKDMFENHVPSISPRSAFDFPECCSPESHLPAGKIVELVTGERQPDWSVSDEWITVR